MVDGYHDPEDETAIPDVTLTGDEFLHVIAVVAEATGLGITHRFPPYGTWNPHCLACVSIMEKGDIYLATLRAFGVRGA